MRLSVLLPTVFVAACATAVATTPTTTAESTQCPQGAVSVEILNVVDGDTMDARFSFPLGLALEDRIRLAGVDTWEVRGEEKPKGLIAKQFVIDWFESNKEGLLAVPENGKFFRGKYGRVVTDLCAARGCLAAALRANGHVNE